MTDDIPLDQRVDQMLSSGKLDQAEAMRLKAVFHSQSDRDAPLRAADTSTTDVKRRLLPLMVLLVIAFLLGAASIWLFTPPTDNVAQTVTTLTPNETTNGRVIDLSALDQERKTTMKRTLPLMIGVVPLAIFAVLGVVLVLVYNGLVTAREQVNAGWAQVENVYQRRLDLVPVLVDAVQTYTEHERETLNELTRARASALQTTSALGGGIPETAEQLKVIEGAQGKVESALARLFAVVENYPELKAGRNFLSLQDQLEGTENRVAMERRNYNEFSRRYNTRLQTFPSNLVATMMGFDSKPYFEAEDPALQAPEDPFGRRSG